MAALKEKHGLKDGEEVLNKERQILRKICEFLIFKTELEVASAKLAVFRTAGDYQEATAAAEMPPTESLPCEEGDAMNAYLVETPIKSIVSECEFFSLDKASKAHFMVQTPSVRPKDAVQHFPVPLVPKDHNAASGRPQVAPSPVNANVQIANIPHDSLVNILKHQNDITSLLVKQHQSSSLPQKEIEYQRLMVIY